MGSIGRVGIIGCHSASITYLLQDARHCNAQQSKTDCMQGNTVIKGVILQSLQDIQCYSVPGVAYNLRL